jgi:DNA-binding LacI/PurR family transcriptional regulator
LRARILAASDILGYAPPSRRARAAEARRAFALIVGDVDNPFYPQVLRQFSSAAETLGWNMQVLVAPERGSVDHLMPQVLGADLDAVVITSADLSSKLAAECRDRALPVTLFNRVQVDAEMNAVCTDNYQGGRLAAERLIGTGRRRLAFVGGRPETSTHLERRRGFLDVLEGAGIVLMHDAVGRYEYGIAHDVGRAILSEMEVPDGVFCANDNMAYAVLDAARSAGLVPGRDISVIGYDDVAMSGWTTFDLTTVSQDIPEMVARTIAGIRTARAGDPGRIEIVPARLIIRGSG